MPCPFFLQVVLLLLVLVNILQSLPQNIMERTPALSQSDPQTQECTERR